MERGYLQGCFACVLGAPGNTVEQRWSTDMAFAMGIWRALTHKDVPPGVNEGSAARHELIAVLVVRGVPTPRPVMFEVGKVVFAVSSVAIKWRDGCNAMFE